MRTSTASLLRVEGTKIVNKAGEEVVLKGAGLGGWMNMENFITGFPGCEFQIRRVLSAEIGDEKAEFLFDKFLEYFFTAADARFFKSLGLNCLRIPFNYRHFEDDLNPRVLKNKGFEPLDRAINICADAGIYTILDMHTAPGAQSPGWHADGGTQLPLFWDHKDFQDRSLWLWDLISKHYASNPWVAGYNPLNEPADPTPAAAGLVQFYDKVYSVIRKNDTNHIIFWDGNTFATDFSGFDPAYKKWKVNCAYSLHDYSLYGFPAFKGKYGSTDEQKQHLEEVLEGKMRWMKERGLCIWNGEWGPVYARDWLPGEAERASEINEARYQALRDQLAIYAKHKLSWSIWTYKDIGFQGMVQVSTTSPWMKLLHPFLLKKQHLALDAWGDNLDLADPEVRHVFSGLEGLIKKYMDKESDLDMYPWKLGRRTATLARNMLISEYLVPEWARHFKGKTFEELDELARSFLFEKCVMREGLNRALEDDARRVGSI